MKLSACMIVKDEEDVIQRCLDSINMVDEVIIVDTGSSDRTIGLIGTYQDSWEIPIHLYEIPWNGSFADMRNKSMDLATGDVLFIIDADEYVEEQNWEIIREAIKHPDFICGMVQVMNTARGPVRGERVMQPRLFKNVPEIRYKYAVHNQIDDSYLAYAKKMKDEEGRDAIIAHIPFQINHTGYDLTEEQVIQKYTPRIEICRQQVQGAIDEGSARDEAYYKYQLALFLTMTGGVDEALNIWEEIEYNNLNVFNRWYAHYIAARAYMKKCHEDSFISQSSIKVAGGPDRKDAEGALALMELSLSHCAGMFSAIEAPQTGYNMLAPEPATWMITGVAMLEYSYLANDIKTRNDAIVMMIDAFLRALTPPKETRCVINSQMLYNDIKAQFKPDTLEYSMLDTDDLQKAVNALKNIQRSLVEFDESLLELEDKEYL